MKIMQPQNSYTANFKNSTQQNQRNYSQVSFGYDQKANEALKQSAELMDCGDLIAYQEYCNGLEDKIRAKESDINNHELKNTITIFVAAKMTLIELTETLLSGLHFMDKETEHYESECEEAYNYTNTDPESDARLPWREALLSEIDEFASTDEDYDTDDKIRSCTSCDEGNSVQKKPTILEQFIPKDSSPKGFDDVAGMDEIKNDFKKHIIETLNNPELAKSKIKKYGKTTPDGYLLSGPPGCGKTHIVEALAAETQLPLYKMNIGNIGSPFLHETSRKIDSAFKELDEIIKETGKPVILFIDELEGVATSRTGVYDNHKVEEVTVLLNKSDKTSERNIILIAATNKPEIVDEAIKRTGRFDKKYFIDLPDEKNRASLFKLDLSKRESAEKLIKNDANINKLAKASEGLSNSDIVTICNSAGDKAASEEGDIILDDVLLIIKSVKEKLNEKKEQEKVNSYIS